LQVASLEGFRKTMGPIPIAEKGKFEFARNFPQIMA
jgi:hypothetical protein